MIRSVLAVEARSCTVGAMANDTVTSADLEPETEIRIDPVCGSDVDVATARDRDLMVDFAGRTYAFCGPGCRDRFLAEPVVYAVAGRSEP